VLGSLFPELTLFASHRPVRADGQVPGVWLTPVDSSYGKVRWVLDLAVPVSMELLQVGCGYGEVSPWLRVVVNLVICSAQANSNAKFPGTSGVAISMPDEPGCCNWLGDGGIRNLWRIDALYESEICGEVFPVPTTSDNDWPIGHRLADWGMRLAG